jgi:hypothetical protein
VNSLGFSNSLRKSRMKTGTKIFEESVVEFFEKIFRGPGI